MAERVKVRRLSPAEGQRLQRIVRRGEPKQGGSVVRWRRAAMILASAGGNTVPVIVRLLAADEDVLEHHPGRVFAFDEFGPLGIRPTGGNCWAREGKPDRLPANYHRTAGVTYFHGCYPVGNDTRWGINHHHNGPRVRRWAIAHAVELCFTPAYASWANPIEAHFGPLRQFTLANSNHPNHVVQTRRLHEYLRWRNAHARHLNVEEAQRRERARIRSEKGHRWGWHDAPRTA